jgi:hypothetical protein
MSISAGTTTFVYERDDLRVRRAFASLAKRVCFEADLPPLEKLPGKRNPNTPLFRVGITIVESSENVHRWSN